MSLGVSGDWSRLCLLHELLGSCRSVESGGGAVMTEYVYETAGTTTGLGRRVHPGWDVTDCSD